MLGLVVIYSAAFITQRCFSIVYEKCSRRCRALSLCTLLRRPVNVETLSRTCCDYERASKGFSYSYHLKTFSHIMRFSLPCSVMRGSRTGTCSPPHGAAAFAWALKVICVRESFTCRQQRIPAQLNRSVIWFCWGGFFQRRADIRDRNPEKRFCLRSGEPLGYLGHLHLLLPRVNALLQPPEFLLGPHVLGDAGSLVFGNLAAQTLVESLLAATLLWKHQRRCGASAQRESVFRKRGLCGDS